MEQQVDELAAVMMKLDELAEKRWVGHPTAEGTLAAGLIETLRLLMIVDARLDEIERKLP